VPWVAARACGTLKTHAGNFGPGSFVWFPEGMLMEHGATDDGPSRRCSSPTSRSTSATPSRTSRPARPAHRLGGRPTSSPPDPSFVAVVADHAWQAGNQARLPGGLDQAGFRQAERGTTSKRSGSSTIGRPQHHRHHGRVPDVAGRRGHHGGALPTRRRLGQVRCVSAAGERFRTTPVQSAPTTRAARARARPSSPPTVAGTPWSRVGREQAERISIPGLGRVS
jgi:hypothetical protein